MLITIDTATLIGAGKMNADGSDLRISSDCGGTTLLPYWIESGINTAATRVWVRVPSLTANSTTILYLGYGNAAATAVSSATDVFDGDPNNGNAAYSSTDQVVGGSINSVVSNSQRGFRFSPNEDVVAVQFGKDEPTGTTRYVTLFDYATQAIVSQLQVSGAAGSYSYAPLTDAVFLNKDQQYLLELYQDTGDGYYYGASSQINSHLTYYEMDYCNNCTKDTFPTNVLDGYHYGHPDLTFLTRQHAASEPTTAAADCSGVLACNPSCTRAFCGDGVVGPGEQCDDGNNVDEDACTNACNDNVCGDGILNTGVEQCDDGNNVDTDMCLNSCATNVCGDGVLNTGIEACDDGNNVDTDACRNNCAAATCGDGVVQDGVEECDDANSDNTDSCTNTCMTAKCGDGFIQAGEDCDDANPDNNDSCTTACHAPACGDGFLQTGEACDDGNTTSGDGCSSACTTETLSDGGTDGGGDAGKGDGGTADGGKNDAGAADAGTKADSGIPSDAGIPGDPTVEGTGCSCDTTGQGTHAGAAGLAATVGLLLALGSRRKRSRKTA